MAHEVRAWLAAATLWAGVVGGAAAQPIPAPQPPCPVNGAAVLPPVPDADPWDLMAPVSDPHMAPHADVPYEDRNGELLAGDPFLDSNRSGPPGFFASVETTFLHPSFNNRLAGPLTLPGVGQLVVSVPTATLPWTVAPEFRIGYRLPQGFGAFALTYRFLFDQGTSATPGIVTTGAADQRALLGFTTVVPPFLPTGPGSLTSRLNVHVIGLDYVTKEFALGPHWDMRWSVGAWIVDNYFDSRVQGTMLEERVSSQYTGAGPHVGLELWRWLSPQAGHGLGVYGRSEAALVYGRVVQNFEANTIAGGVPVAGAANILTGDPLAVPGNGSSEFSPIMRLQTGLTWSPDWACQRLRFTTGYEFEGWWWFARLPGPVGNSFRLGSGSTLTTNGVFLRAEWKY